MSSSQEVHIVAVLSPAAGKLARVNELLKNMCADVHTKEDYTLRYLQTQQIDAKEGAEPDIIFFETYKNKAAADQHMTEAHFQQLFATFTEEGLFAKPPYVAQAVSMAGFDLDHKLL